MSLSLLALGLALFVMPRWYACVAVASMTCAGTGFVLAYELVAVVPEASGLLVVGAVSALVAAVLAVVEGLVSGVSFAPSELYRTAS